MALLIGDNFNYQGKKPNFERDSFDTYASMKTYPETSINEGHLSYCEEDGEYYIFKSSNTVDDITGKWRKFTTGGNVDYDIATPESDGLMSKEDKQKLDDVVAKVAAFVVPNGYELIMVQKQQ